MSFNEILRDWIVPIVACLLTGICTASAFFSKAKGKSIKNVINMILEDESICDIFDDVLKAKTGQEFETLEMYLQWIKEQAYSKVILYLKEEMKFPDAVVDSLTIENVSSILESLMDKYGVTDLAKDIFESTSNKSIEDNQSENIDEVEDSADIDEDVNEIDLGNFY